MILYMWRLAVRSRIGALINDNSVSGEIVAIFFGIVIF